MKMKRRKSMLSLLLTAVLLLTLAACTELPSETGEPTGEPVSTEEAPEEEKLREFNRQLRIVVDGEIYTARACVEEDTVYLEQGVIQKLLGVSPAETVTVSGQPCGNLHAAAETAGAARMIPDLSLDSVYLWTTLPESGIQADAAGTIPAGRQKSDPVTYGEFFSMLDAAVGKMNPEGLQQWKASLPEARAAKRTLLRGEAMMMLLYAGIAMGPEFTEFNADWGPIDNAVGPAVWEDLNQVMQKRDLFQFLPNPRPCGLSGFVNAPYIQDWDFFGVALRYSFGRVSLKSAQTLLDYDPEQNSMRMGDLLTMEEASNAVIRLVDSVPDPEDWIPSDSPEACTLNQTILTPELMELAGTLPPIPEEEPAVLNCAVLGMEYNMGSLAPREMDRHARILSQWGFNSFRYGIPYTLLFSQDGSAVSKSALEQMDRIVASAVRYRIHFNLLLITLPGRWASYDAGSFTSQGEFDMFTNPQRQAEALRVWQTLAKRYADVPSSVLSFSPCWEAMNFDLSTGLPANPIYQRDVSAFHVKVTETIRKEDPDRYILYEPTASSNLEWGKQEIAEGIRGMEPKFQGVQAVVNFCAEPYVYAEMTAAEGENIDNNNHSMFKPAYPVTICSAGGTIGTGNPMRLDGDLPKGTQLKLYLDRINGSGILRILGDGKELCMERLSYGDFSQDPPTSRFYPYARSEKEILVSLPEDLKTLEITFTGNLQWSGIELILPESFARERWWFPSDYDAFLEGSENRFPNPEIRKTSTIQLSPNGGTPGTIHIDGETLTYTSGEIQYQANRDTVFAVGEEISQMTKEAAFRVERAAFCIGTQADSALQYYGDFLNMCSQYHFGWLTNDYCYGEMLGGSDAIHKYPGAKRIPTAEGYVWKELLQLYQSHMPEPIPLTP